MIVHGVRVPRPVQQYVLWDIISAVPFCRVAIRFVDVGVLFLGMLLLFLLCLLLLLIHLELSRPRQYICP